MGSHTDRRHFLLIPFPAFGHIIPLLELGKKLSRLHDVTFAVSAAILEEMRKKDFMVKPDQPVRFLAIEDGYVPLNAFSPHSVAPLVHIFESVLPGISNLVEYIGSNKTFLDPENVVIIIDEFVAGGAAACVEKKIPFYHFLTSSARIMTYSLKIDENYPTILNDGKKEIMKEYIPGQPLQPVTEIVKQTYMKVNATIPFIEGVIINSVRELEPDVLDELKNHPLMRQIPLYFVGPLFGDEEMTGNQQEILNWLNKQSRRSVIYISFGSIALPNSQQIVEITNALTVLKRPFIWTLPPAQHHLLPKGMIDTTATGNVQFKIVSWAPQKLILNHPSTKVFLSHCGWNACIESLTGGVPILAWPLFADQLINAQFLVKLGSAIIIKSTREGMPDIFTQDDLCRGLESIEGEEGWICQERSCVNVAQVWKTRLGAAQEAGGSSYLDFQKLMTSARFD